MASFIPSLYYPGFRAGADLSEETNRYKAVKLDASGNVILCVANDFGFIGFLQNTPENGAPAEVAGLGGGSLAISGGAIDEGALLTTDANGDLIAIATGQTRAAVARAVPSAVDNDVFDVIVLGGTSHTAP